MGRHYLFFATLSYSYTILRPLQKEIWRRGDEVKWFLEETCPNMLLPGEQLAETIEEVMEYNPEAVFAPGNYVYDFFPGVKVAVFHGYPIRKRIEKKDDHFTIRGWFDIYCTQGESSTPYFTELSEEKGYFKIYETGWCEMDAFFDPLLPPEPRREVPTVLYSTTFTKGITSAWKLLPTIDSLATQYPWKWIITFHPKLDDAQLIEQYERMAARHDNVEFSKVNKSLEIFRCSDVMLCDSSSIMVEYMMLDKPVVTFCNTHPGPHLIDVLKEEEVGPAIERALLRPESLMSEIRKYTSFHEAHRDGKNSARVLDAVDDFVQHYQGRMKRKPLNLVRKLKLRWKLKYFKI
ncbi:MAG: CDP-glycerol glycerophosphotransferase family protein [Bacteroidaceae bacterium]|nr:CDP-glycerol glycerophosphotransferase family protein [Bacteroidaceae bacterium]